MNVDHVQKKLIKNLKDKRKLKINFKGMVTKDEISKVRNNVLLCFEEIKKLVTARERKETILSRFNKLEKNVME
jgi:hypothetical protein